MKKKLSFIIPCHNEEKNVTLLHDEILKVFKDTKYSIELIYINDGSKDNTIDELKSLLDKTSFEINIINFSRNFGKEAAMYAGLEQSSGDFTIIIDADLQQKPSYALEMIEFLGNHDEYDSICCYQKDRIESKTMSFIKEKFYKIITNISDIEFVNGASDFRVFRRCVVESILTLKEKTRFSKGIFSWVGFNTYYMPYTPEDRINGKSSFNFKSLLLYAFSGIISFSIAPLRIATFSGILFALLSFIYLIVVIIQKVFFTINVPGYPTLIVSILLIGSLILVCLGIMGEYVARIYMETKQRPIYIAKERLSNKKHNKKENS